MAASHSDFGIFHKCRGLYFPASFFTIPSPGAQVLDSAELPSMADEDDQSLNPPFPR